MLRGLLFFSASSFFYTPPLLSLTFSIFSSLVYPHYSALFLYFILFSFLRIFSNSPLPASPSPNLSLPRSPVLFLFTLLSSSLSSPSLCICEQKYKKPTSLSYPFLLSLLLTPSSSSFIDFLPLPFLFPSLLSLYSFHHFSNHISKKKKIIMMISDLFKASAICQES